VDSVVGRPRQIQKTQQRTCQTRTRISGVGRMETILCWPVQGRKSSKTTYYRTRARAGQRARKSGRIERLQVSRPMTLFCRVRFRVDGRSHCDSEKTQSLAHMERCLPSTHVSDTRLCSITFVNKFGKVLLPRQDTENTSFNKSA